MGIRIASPLFRVLANNLHLPFDVVQRIPIIDFHTGTRCRWRLGIKRLIDLVLSTLFLIITFPFCFILALLIRLDSRGTPLFCQRRIVCFVVLLDVYDNGHISRNSPVYNGVNPLEKFWVNGVRFLGECMAGPANGQAD